MLPWEEQILHLILAQKSREAIRGPGAGVNLLKNNPKQDKGMITLCVRGKVVLFSQHTPMLLSALDFFGLKIVWGPTRGLSPNPQSTKNSLQSENS